MSRRCGQFFGNLFPNFETLDVKIASSLKKMIPNFALQKEGLSARAEGSDKMTDSFAEHRALS